MDETYKPKCKTKWKVLFNQNLNWKFCLGVNKRNIME